MYLLKYCIEKVAVRKISDDKLKVLMPSIGNGILLGLRHPSDKVRTLAKKALVLLKLRFYNRKTLWAIATKEINEKLRAESYKIGQECFEDYDNYFSEDDMWPDAIDKAITKEQGKKEGPVQDPTTKDKDDDMKTSRGDKDKKKEK